MLSLMKKFLWSSSKYGLIIYDNIQNFTTSQGDDYTTNLLLDYTYFKEHYKMIATDLTKLQAFGADPKAIQEISFTGNLDWLENTTMYFIIEETKQTILNFSQGVVTVFWIYFVLL